MRVPAGGLGQLYVVDLGVVQVVLRHALDHLSRPVQFVPDQVAGGVYASGIQIGAIRQLDLADVGDGPGEVRLDLHAVLLGS